MRKKWRTILLPAVRWQGTPIFVGDVEVLELDGEIYLDVKGEAAIKHLLEEAFVKEGKEVWTGEHADIKIEPGVYKYVPQIEYDVLGNFERRVLDWPIKSILGDYVLWNILPL